MRKHVVLLVVLALAAGACGTVRATATAPARSDGDDTRSTAGEHHRRRRHRGLDHHRRDRRHQRRGAGALQGRPRRGRGVRRDGERGRRDQRPRARRGGLRHRDDRHRQRGSPTRRPAPKVFASVGSESAFDTGGLEAANASAGSRTSPASRPTPTCNELPFVFPRIDRRLRRRGRGTVVRRGVPRGGVERRHLPRHVPQVTVRAAENLIEARESVGWVFTYRAAHRAARVATTRRTRSRCRAVASRPSPSWPT